MKQTLVFYLVILLCKMLRSMALSIFLFEPLNYLVIYLFAIWNLLQRWHKIVLKVYLKFIYLFGFGLFQYVEKVDFKISLKRGPNEWVCRLKTAPLVSKSKELTINKSLKHLPKPNQHKQQKTWDATFEK